MTPREWSGLAARGAAPPAPWLAEALELGERVGSRFALTVPRRLPAGASGSRLGVRAGASLEFQDHRDYEPGDDLRFVDWGAFARSDRLVVKRHREEVTPHLDVLVDGSASMALPDRADRREPAARDGVSSKAGAVAALAALLSAAARSSGLSSAVWLCARGCQRLEVGPGGGTRWEGLAFEGAGTPASALGAAPPRLAPRGLRVLLSDLLFGESPGSILLPLAQAAASLLVLQVVSSRDRDPGAEGPVRVVDVETGEEREMVLSAETARRHREAFEGHREAWSREARRAGAVLVTLEADPLLRSLSADGGRALAPLVEAEVLVPAG